LQFFQEKKIILILSVLIIAACNPVKQVLKDKAKLDKVAEEVVRRGYCVNETTFVKETVIKEVFVKDTSETSEVKTSLKNINFYQELPSGAKVRITEDGNLSVDCPVKIEKTYQLDVETKTVRDRSLENILKRDIEKGDSTIREMKLQLKEREQLTKDVEKKLKASQAKFYGLMLLLISVFGFLAYKKIRNFLPF
jgi:hypothetical protein